MSRGHWERGGYMRLPKGLHEPKWVDGRLEEGVWERRAGVAHENKPRGGTFRRAPAARDGPEEWALECRPIGAPTFALLWSFFSFAFAPAVIAACCIQSFPRFPSTLLVNGDRYFRKMNDGMIVLFSQVPRTRTGGTWAGGRRGRRWRGRRPSTATRTAGCASTHYLLPTAPTLPSHPAYPASSIYPPTQPPFRCPATAAAAAGPWFRRSSTEGGGSSRGRTRPGRGPGRWLLGARRVPRRGCTPGGGRRAGRPPRHPRPFLSAPPACRASWPLCPLIACHPCVWEQPMTKGR